jgi:MFS family permease
MNGVVAAISFGMLGLFLPLTIFLQSVLGLTALQAGLTTAPMSVISMFVAPVAGRFADRVGGKWILFLGVGLFAGGMGILIDSSHLGVSRWHLLPGLIVAGFGLGMTFAPLQTIAMRNIEPRMAGAASGLINTTRQMGGVIGSAAVGALLQTQLSSKLGTAATENAGKLPPQYRDTFISAFKNASGNLDVGTGQNAIKLPPGIPDSVASVLTSIGKTVFDTGFTNAMRVTLALPIGVMALAALSVLLVKRRRASIPDDNADRVVDAVPASN